MFAYAKKLTVVSILSLICLQVSGSQRKPGFTLNGGLVIASAPAAPAVETLSKFLTSYYDNACYISDQGNKEEEDRWNNNRPRMRQEEIAKLKPTLEALRAQGNSETAAEAALMEITLKKMQGSIHPFLHALKEAGFERGENAW